ncbi:MAG: tetratricopeptide repeat protein [Candidatus Poribacteria bacterium]|nr:tetratricopeptide repeat protein [Candidatus Poribacteria bacterium]
MNDKVLIGVGIAALLGVLFFPSGSSQKVQTLYEEAEQFLVNERYPEAIQKYEESLEEAEKGFVKTEVIDPDYQTLAKYKIAHAYAQQAEKTGNVAEYDEALNILEEIYQTATIDKHREGIVFLWGYVLMKTERLEEAEPKFRELIQNFPNSLFHENAWYSIAQLNYDLQDFDKARDAYRQIVDRFPNSDFRDDSQYRIAVTYFEEQNYDQSFREFDAMTPEDFPGSPLLPEASYKAAYSLLQLDRLEEAIDRYNRFVADYPDSIFRTGAHFDLGTIYTRQSDFDNAIQNYQLAIENTDNMDLKAEIQYEIGDNYMDAENYLSAAEAYQMVVTTYPNSPYVDAARFGAGEAHMSEAGDNTKSSGEPDTQNFELAIQGYMSVLSEHPDSDYRSHSTYQIGEANYEMKRYEDALVWFRRTQEDFPDDPLAPHSLYAELWCLTELGRFEEVLARGRSFIEANADNEDFDIQAAEIQTKLGDIMFEQNEFLVAAGEYERAAAYPHLPKFYATRLRSLYQIGVCYFQHADKSGDKSFFEKALPALNEAIEKFTAKDPDPDNSGFDLNYEFPERIALLENSILSKAEAHEKLEQWAEARAAYALIPPPSENYGRARVLSAESYEKEGNIDEAINLYRAVSEDGTLDETWQSLGAIRLADLLRDQKRWAEAATAYGNVVERYPSSEYAGASQYLQGISLYSIEPRTDENLKASVTAFQAVVAQWPDDANAPDALYGVALSQKALAESKSGSWEDVLASVNQLTNMYGSRTDERSLKAINSGNLLRVLALEELGEVSIDEIVASLRQVTQSETADAPTRVTAQLKIGNLLFENGRLEDAVREYRALGEMFPDSDQAPLGLYQAAVSAFKSGESLSEKEDPKAASMYQQAAELTAQALSYADKLDNEMLVKINYTRGSALQETGQPQEAIQALQAVAALKDSVEDQALVEAAYTKLAQMYRSLGQHQEASAEYQRLAATSSNPLIRLQSFMARADILENNLNDPAGALENYQAAASVEIESDFIAQALYRAGLILSEKASAQSGGDDEAAKAYAEQAIVTFERLSSNYERSENSQVKLMVADAGVRASDLYTLAGRDLSGAIDEALAARDRAVEAGDVAQKVQAQYQVATLRDRYARQLRASADPNALDVVILSNGGRRQGYIDVSGGGIYSNGSLSLGALQEGTGQLSFSPISRSEISDVELSYKTVARLSAQDYLKAVEFAEPLDSAPDQSITFVGYALYQAGVISYSLRGPRDLPITVEALPRFVALVDSGKMVDSGEVTSSEKSSELSAGQYTVGKDSSAPRPGRYRVTATNQGNFIVWDDKENLKVNIILGTDLESYEFDLEEGDKIRAEVKVELRDLSNAENSEQLSELQNALYYLGVAYYDLASANEMDPDLFAQSAAALQSLVDRYPSHEEAGLWQYQVGEAHYAAQLFDEALKSYIQTAERYPNHENAPEALYSAAACHDKLSQEDGMMEAYDLLVTRYPNHRRSLDAYITLANHRFNESLDLNEADPEQRNAKLEKLESALSMYRKVAESELSEADQANRAKSFVKDTEEYIASIRIVPLDEAYSRAGRSAEALTPAMAALEKFASEYTDTKQAVIAWTRLGDGNMIFAEQAAADGDTDSEIEYYEKSLQFFTNVRRRYVDAQGVEMTPADPSMERALTYANRKIVDIQRYVNSVRAAREAKSGSE